MNLFHHLEDFVARLHHQKKAPDHNDYNHTFFPPVAMVETLPPGSMPFEWAIRVASINFRITLNLFYLARCEELPELEAKLDRLVADLDKGSDLIKILADLAGVISELIHDLGGTAKNAAHELARIIGLLTDPDNNLALDFWLIFQDLQNALLAEAPDRPMDSIEAYDALFHYLPLPAISKTYDRDETFGELRVAGPNPTSLTRLTAPMANFPVSEEMFTAVMGTDDDLQTAIDEGRVYIVDHGILEGAAAGLYPGPRKYLCAPIAMFAVPKQGEDRRLRPIAIQCGQKQAPESPISTPPVAEDEQAALRWRMAKTHFQVADGNFHEAVAHLGRTHLMVSAFSIATPNCLGSDHPVGRLLEPHFQGTFSINNSAQDSLIASKGVINQIMSGTIDQSRVFAQLGYLSHATDFNGSFFPDVLKRQGVEDPAVLPHYPYRDCGLMLWQAIEAWVGDYLELCYLDEDGPARDEALQAWYRQLVASDGGRIGNFGEDGGIRTRTYLRQVLTMVIWTASAGHAAVNFPQLGVMSYPPAMPLAAYAPPPRADRTYTEADYLATLPPFGPAVLQINTGQLLGGVYYTRLGDYGDDTFEDPSIREALARFRANLTQLEQEMIDRYPDYPYLRPSKVPQSINI